MKSSHLEIHQYLLIAGYSDTWANISFLTSFSGTVYAYYTTELEGMYGSQIMQNVPSISTVVSFGVPKSVQR